MNMAKTGVKKYDDLPSRLGFWDVDAWRASYAQSKKKYLLAEKMLENIYNDFKRKGL